ncbi:MAG: leucine-rich repeat protein [Ruminococcus sp.]|jgi:hypothetical protein|nr:leucine-rich repeat protein [Ruminococcus sp.]MCR5074190.1 leucine-rich repeat protein [Ruminococcus sp.]
MQCEKCGTDLKPKYVACPNCGAPVPQTIDGFENTIDFQHELRAIVVDNGPRAVMNKTRFIGLLYDHVPDHNKERRLLQNMYLQGVFKMLLEDDNREIAIMKAKSYMLSEIFLAENAAEFVLACFTYLLGWPYESSMRILPEDNEPEPEPEKKARVSIDDKIFRPIDAVRYRLRSNIEIADGYTKIESFCFDGFGSLRTVKLPESLLAIGDYAFSSCKRLRGLELPESLRVIKQGAFCQCAKLAMVKIPTGILEIEDSTFSFCTSLETIDIPDTVSSIGAEAFSGCEKLRKLYLPDSVKFIDANAFSYCPNLTIHCFENSYVHKFCLSNRINFRLVTTAGIEED